MLIRDYMDKVSRWRSHIMGFCILSVILAHSEMAFMSGPLSYAINKLWVIDMFFFITGMSVYRSLKKDDRLLPFYRRRFKRIYPRYLPIIIIYFIPIFALYTDGQNLALRLRELLGNVILLGWVNGMDNQFNWYLQSLLFFYLLSPPLFMAVRQAEGKGKILLGLVLFFCVSQICFIGAGTLVAYTRTIAFVMGLVAEDLADRRISFKINIPLLLLVWVIGNVLAYYTLAMPLEKSMYYGLCWYPGVLVTPGMLLICCWVFALMDKLRALRWVNGIFDVLGRYSLEGYLVNVLVYDIIARLRITVEGNLRWFIIALAICPLSVLYGKLMDRVQSGKKLKA